MNKSESISKLAVALVKAQSEVKNATKNAQNPHFKSNFADLSAVIDATVPTLNANGLSVVQLAIPDNEMCIIETMLIHESGEWLSGQMSTPLAKRDPQGIGSATTYLRRYSLAALLCITQTDDDGEAASVPKTAAKPPQAVANPNQRAELLARITKARAGVKAAGCDVENLELSKMSEYDLAKYLDKLNAQYKSLQEKAK